MTISCHSHWILPEKMQICQDYMQALEEERRKILVFQRELPLCLELVTQAIESCKQQLSGIILAECNLKGQSESSEETSGDLPIVEEFIPIKRASSHSDGEEQEHKKLKTATLCELDGDKNIKKSDWLRSVQLWNQNPDPITFEDSPEVTKACSGGAFHPFKKDEACGTSTEPPVKHPVPPPASTSSSAGIGNKKEEKEGQSRKARRCWSNELHHKFLGALHVLGGSHLATPKQVRELMKVDGLTNDEVKSHLQKYRLHTRRPSPPVETASSTSPAATQAPQFVVVAGGLWMPPDYTAAMAAAAMPAEEAAGGAASNGIYAPVAILPPAFDGASGPSKQRRDKITTASSMHTRSN